MDCLPVDAVIFGGGAAGLWLLDELRRGGGSAMLVEAASLGDGQTIASQGILHSGLKYSLQGLLTAAAREAREMPALWRRCLLGDGPGAPDLRGTEIRSESFYLWGTESASSRIGMLGARLGLRVTPRSVSRRDAAPLLRGCPGSIFRVDEQVVSPESLLKVLAAGNEDAILQVHPCDVEFAHDSANRVARVELRSADGELRVAVAPRWVVLAAGKGNGRLRERVGLDAAEMQCRPLHMVLVRGGQPEFYGHCVDGARTRVSITSAKDQAGRTVWQVGGQIAEDGVRMDQQTLVARAQAELLSVLPGLDLRGTEWSTYRIDRAEGTTAAGGRPDSFRLVQEGNIVTAWPTKLVLVPQLSAAIRGVVLEHRSPLPAMPAADAEILQSWPRPDVALPPWERRQQWVRFHSSGRAAA